MIFDNEIDIINEISKLDFEDIDFEYSYSHSKIMIDGIVYRCVFCSTPGVFNHWFPIKNEKEIFVKMFLAMKDKIKQTTNTIKLIDDMGIDQNNEIFHQYLLCNTSTKGNLMFFIFYVEENEGILN